MFLFPCTQSEDFRLQVNKECTKAACLRISIAYTCDGFAFAQVRKRKAVKQVQCGTQWCILFHFAVVNKMFIFSLPQLKLTQMRMWDSFQKHSYLRALCLRSFSIATESCPRALLGKLPRGKASTTIMKRVYCEGQVVSQTLNFLVYCSCLCSCFFFFFFFDNWH